MRCRLRVALLALGACLMLGACQPHAAAPPPPSPPLFSEISDSAGIRFRHRQFEEPKYVPEIMGSGAAWGDVDGDGWPDLYLVNGSGSKDISNPAAMPSSRLYRNDGDGTFTDITDASGAGNRGWGMGAVFADYDNDGRPDLLVTNYFSPNKLYHNNGDGAFTEVGRQAGIAGPPGGFRSMGAAWGDYDGDGFLDAYIPGHLQFSFQNAPSAKALRKAFGVYLPLTLDPTSYNVEPGHLYHNNGDGTFTDITASAGVPNKRGKGLQVVWSDFNNDGRPDVFIGNDVTANALYLNNGDGTFTDASVQAYMADPRSSMGIAVGDYNQDGAMDVFATHWVSEENALFENRLLETGSARRLTFSDVNDVTELGPVSIPLVGWGTEFFDYDNDGILDVLVVNGHTNPDFNDRRHVVQMTTLLFHGRPNRVFENVSAAAGPWFQQPIVGRGAAFGDYDRDGGVDAAVNENNGPAALLHNVGPRGHWIGLRPSGRAANRDGVGARVELHAGASHQCFETAAGGSYLSGNDRTVMVGLGPATGADRVVIRWPGGRAQEIGPLGAGGVIEIAQPR